MNRRISLVATTVVAVATVFACRKPAPLEVVYTGNGPAGTGAVGPPAKRPGTTPGETPDPPPDSSFKKSALLAAIGQCTFTQAQRFEAAARTLRDAANTWAQDPANETSAAAARMGWLDAMSIWEENELFRFGP